jgi:hypothetical protein
VLVAVASAAVYTLLHTEAGQQLLQPKKKRESPANELIQVAFGASHCGVFFWATEIASQPVFGSLLF